MTRDEFRQQMELYRQAREQNPQLSYWEWKVQRFDDGTNSEGVQQLPYERVVGPYLDEVVVTPNGSYVQQPYNERLQQDWYNSQMLDYWSKASQLDILNEAVRPVSAFDPIQQIGAVRNKLKGRSYWNSLAGNERNLGIVPEVLDVNPIATDAINFVAGLYSPMKVVSKLNKVNKLKLLNNKNFNSKLIKNFSLSTNDYKYNVQLRKKFLNNIRKKGFEITNVIANPRKKDFYEGEFYVPANEVSITPIDNSYVDRFIKDYVSTFDKYISNQDAKKYINDYIIVKTYPRKTSITGEYDPVTKQSYINPAYMDDIENTYIHEILSHGTDDLVKDINLNPDYEISVQDVYQNISDITSTLKARKWQEARATLNELRSELMRDGEVKNIKDIENVSDELLNDYIKNRMPELNVYGYSYIKNGYDYLPQNEKELWLNSVRETLRYLPIVSTPVIYTNDDNYSDGTDKNGIRLTSERPVTVNPYTGEFEYGYNPGAGYLKSAIDTRDLLDFTPVGNATTVYDAYNAYDAGDYLGAGLIGAAAILPGAIAKPAKKLVKRVIPEIHPNYVSDKLNQLIKKNKEIKPNGLSAQMYDDAINQRNHILEELQTNQDYWNRAADIQREFGDDYTSAYIDAMEGYWNGYLGMPEPRLGVEEVRASMNAKQDAISRFNSTGQPAGIYDFEYQINPNYEVTNPITRHELSHYIDFNVSKSPSADRNNSMFKEMKKDLSKGKNPMYPDNTSYYSQGTEQKSYMNTLRQYMYDTGQIESIGDKVTTKQIKEAIKTLPEQYNSVKAAFKQFKTPSSYTKWFNKMPLLTIPGAAMYIQSNSNKESN